MRDNPYIVVLSPAGYEALCEQVRTMTAKVQNQGVLELQDATALAVETHRCVDEGFPEYDYFTVEKDGVVIDADLK